MASFKWDKTGLFAAGVLFGTAGIKFLSSKDAKKVYTECTRSSCQQNAFSSDHVGYYHRHRIGHCHHDTGRFHQQFRYGLYGIHGCQQHYRGCISEKYVTGDDIQRNDLFHGPQIHEDDRG